MAAGISVARGAPQGRCAGCWRLAPGSFVRCWRMGLPVGKPVCEVALSRACLLQEGGLRQIRETAVARPRRLTVRPRLGSGALCSAPGRQASVRLLTAVSRAQA